MEGTFVRDGIEAFIQQLIRRGSDERTIKAYRLDLEHLYRWLREKKAEELDREAAENYLEYLTKEKKLRASTVTRKYRVLNYYLSYLSEQGLLTDRRPLSVPVQVTQKDMRKEGGPLSKAEIDRFFAAIQKEYEDLGSDFRKRICLRDLVMMELLFYHGIEVSELLRLELSDYDRETGVLTLQKKRGKTEGIFLYSRALRERLERWTLDHGEFEREAEYKGRMFLSKLGRPLSMKMVINIFEKYRVLAGIEKEVTPKDLKGCMGEYAKELLMERCG